MLACVASFTLPACVGTPEREPGTRVVIPLGSGPGRTPEEIEASRRRVDAAIARAETLRAEGRGVEALAALDGALEEHPADPELTRVLEMRRAVRSEILREHGLAGRITLDSPRFVLGDTVSLSVRLTNLGEAVMEIPLRHRNPGGRVDSRESPTSLVLALEYQDWDFLGSTVEQERGWIVPLEDDIRILPGESWEHRLEIETEDAFFRPDLAVYRRIRVGGRLQAVEIRSGDLRWFAPVVLEDATFEILPRNIEPIEKDPAGTLARALEASARSDAPLNHVFFAAIVLHRTDPDAAVRALLDALASDRPGLRQTALATLRLVSGRSDLEQREDWEAHFGGSPR